MTRAHRSYNDAPRTNRVFEGADVSEPVAGFFRHRLVSGGVRGGVRIWYGQPKDPVTGELMDRSLRWQAEFDGEYVDFDRVWPACVGEPITEQDYAAFIARKTWAEQNAPNSAFANRTRRYDPLSSDTPLPF